MQRSFRKPKLSRDAENSSATRPAVQRAGACKHKKPKQCVEDSKVQGVALTCQEVLRLAMEVRCMQHCIHPLRFRDPASLSDLLRADGLGGRRETSQCHRALPA
eukprot:2199134-Amphidinium_carterae.1